MLGSTTGRIVLLTLAALVAWWLYVSTQPPVDKAATAAEQQALGQSQLPNATDAQIAAALKPVEAALAATERDVVKIELVAVDEDLPWISKVGGVPYLAIGEKMPVTEDGHEMVLLAQINFADVPPMAGYPERGLLQFFIVRASDEFVYGMNLGDYSVQSLMQQHSFRVRFIAKPVSDRAQLQTVELPDTQGLTPHDPRKPRVMRFRKARERISITDVDAEKLFGAEPYAWIEREAARLQVNEDDFAERVFSSPTGSKIGGYPHFTQADPRPAGSPLRLLLQLDSDDEMMWGDVGVGGFFIDPADLARADFSRVLYSWDCY